MNGATAVWPCSHAWPYGAEAKPGDEIAPLLGRGDCLLYDYRALHSGRANRSRRQRPVLFLTYARKWFFDESNHRRRAPIDMPREELAKVPDEHRELLARASGQRMKVARR